MQPSAGLKYQFLAFPGILVSEQNNAVLPIPPGHSPLELGAESKKLAIRGR